MIKLKDGTTISDYHCQDCCETVYADWDALEDTTFDPNEITIETLEIDTNPDEGFRINGYFVPCYNIQNGYYSSDLQLIITKNGHDTLKIQVNVKDKIY